MDSSITYMIKGFTGLNQNKLRKILTKKGLVEKTTGSFVNFMYVVAEPCQAFDKSTYTIHADIKNMLHSDKTNITSKDLLYKNVEKYYPNTCIKHFAHTILAKDVKEIKANEPLIIRPVGIGAQSGTDIYVVSDMNTLNIVLGRIGNKYSNVIASKYLVDVRTFNGKKFHVRSFMLVSTLLNTTKVFKYGRIATAKNKYVKSQFEDASIHDTHFKSTDKEYIFPDDYPYDCDIIYLQIRKISKRVGNVLINKTKSVKSYEESKHAFEIFACDFLIESNDNVILMEVNEKIGFFESGMSAHTVDSMLGPWSKKYSRFSYRYFKWMYKYGVKPYLDLIQKL